MSRGLSILIAARIASVPRQGGWTWAVLQYVLGLRRLGHQVSLFEPINESAVRPEGARLVDSENASYFRGVTDAFGFAERACLMSADTSDTVGMSFDELHAELQSADVLLNISGLPIDQSLVAQIPIR